jgi:hypothetical protein
MGAIQSMITKKPQNPGNTPITTATPPRQNATPPITNPNSPRANSAIAPKIDPQTGKTVGGSRKIKLKFKRMKNKTNKNHKKHKKYLNIQNN